jgi:tRNA U34 5-carboxymethylaminomethyl modifying enzyme MnmG/GidA
MRKIIFLIKQCSEELVLPGWRQANQLYKKIKRLYRNAQKNKNSFRRSKRRKETKEKEMKAAYKRYISECAKLLERAKKTLAEAEEWSIKGIAIACEIKKYINHGVRQIDQIIRRVINGEKIPHEEKIFSLFEVHTEWISKGKAGIPQELGLNVCIVEDQYKFILHHKVMEKIVVTLP